MQSEKHWKKKLESTYKKFRFRHGFKLVFGKWGTLAGPDTAFLTPYPGLSVPKGHVRKFEKKLIAEKDGNSYKLELEDANSPINKQFMRLTKLIGRKPNKILTGVATPFRTGGWDSFTPEQQREAKNFGLKFWDEPLHAPTLRLIIVSGTFTFDIVKEIMEINTEPKIVKSGWKRIVLKRFEIENGPTVVQLPYLGRFKLLSKKKYRKQLKKVFKGILD